MDPQEEFKKRYNAYVTQRSSQTTSPTPPAPSNSKKFSPNKFYFLGIIVGLLIVTPVASYLFLANRLTPPPSKTASTDLTAKNQPAEQEINLEMQKVWGPYYEQAKNDPKLRASAKRNVILRLAAAKEGISKSMIASNEGTGNLQKTENSLTEKVVTFRKIHVLSGYIGLNPDNLPLYTKTVEDAKASMEAIRNLMITENKSLAQAFEAIKESGEYSLFSLQEDVTVTKDSRWDQPFLGKILASRNGEVSPVIESFGSLLLFQVIEALDTPYATLQDYLNAQK